MGTELTRVVPKVMGPEFTRPGILSWSLVKARSLPPVRPPPRATVATAADGKSLEVSMMKVEAFWPDPIVTEPATNVNTTVASTAMAAEAVVHTTVVDGLNNVAVAVDAQAMGGVVTRVTTNVVSAFFNVKELPDDKVRVRTLLARATVAPEPVAQLVHVATLEAVAEFNENPENGMAS